jgi:hypothetical protein
MDTLIAEELRIEVASDPDAIRAVWLGKSIERHPGRVLDPFLDGLLAAARQRGVPLEHHFERLELFNSSTITSIIHMIQSARERGVRIVIVYDRAVKWQKLSFDALGVLAEDGLCEMRST